MEKRQKIFADTKGVIMGMYNQLQHDYDVMTMTLPEDKKDFVKKEVKAVSEKLEGESRKISLMYIANVLFPCFIHNIINRVFFVPVVTRFEDKVQKIVDFVGNLKAFDASLKNMDAWMKEADANLNEIKNASGSMTPEDRVSLTMELEEDVAAKVKVIEENIKIEEELLPQGENVSRWFNYLLSSCFKSKYLQV